MKILKNILLLGIAVLSLSACQKEETMDFPDYDKNWYVVDDNPSDSVSHAIYLFYKDFGIPVFTNDTIGSQQRVDVFNKEYTHYETLTLSYSMGGMASASSSPVVDNFTYANRANVPAFLRYIRQEIMPALPKAIHIQSLFLVDQMTSFSFGSYAFKGLNTLVISNVSRLSTMDESEKKKMKGAILRSALTDYILNQDAYSSLLAKFYQISRSLSPTQDIYHMYKWSLNQYVTGADPNDWNHPTVQEVGFLDTDPQNTYYTPTSTWMDVNMYVEAALTYNQDEFTQLYGTYPYIMQKYTIIQNIINSLK
ncbi:hypothetical protein [Xylanibacter oryzae]|uniref:hypothetical protein n=1 Tax=Xylanibacter oryzae TaxID=185293 RepID=UPI0004B2F18F|nr:hypothetical protein [Xylanibacter oryzae]